MKFKQLSMTVAALCVAGSAMAAPAAGPIAQPKLGMVYDAGGKFDKSFNQSAFEGLQRFSKETGIKVFEVQANSDTQAEQVMRGLARKKVDMIAAIGFSQTQAVQKVAREFPNVRFVLVDSVAQGPNIESVMFKEQEGSYLVGVAAAMASKSKKLGFVGGMDIPLIRKFGCGYVGGAKAAGATDVIQNMTGDTPAAWNDPTKGGEIAKSQIDQGADVVYAAAGGTGVGVLQAAADAGKLGIGVDSNQNGLQPGKILTSMVKRVDLAVYNAFMDSKNGAFTAGINDLGLKEDGVGYAMDDNNKALVTPEMLEAVEKAKADIIAGTIKVHDYMSDNACPY